MVTKLLLCIQEYKNYMRPLITLIVSGILLAGPVYAQHWHEDEKHWKQHGHGPDHDDHGQDHHAKDQPVRRRSVGAMAARGGSLKVKGDV